MDKLSITHSLTVIPVIRHTNVYWLINRKKQTFCTFKIQFFVLYEKLAAVPALYKSLYRSKGLFKTVS